MDKIKSLLHRDKESKEETSGPTGKISGEGSHFGSDSSKAQYGAQPGVGISSFTEAQGLSGTTPMAATHDPTMPSTSTTSDTGAPQIQQSDFGERLVAPTATSTGVGSATGLESGPTTTTDSSTGLTGTSLADRSVPAGNSAAVAQPFTERAFALGGDSTTTAPITTQNWPDAGAGSSTSATGTTSAVGGTGLAGATSTLDQGAISSTTGASGHHSTFTGERLDSEHASHQQIRSFNEPGAIGTTTDTTVTSSGQHHVGRDAALVGAGGVGAAGTAAVLEHGSGTPIDPNASTGPASSTIGPHSSNIANIMDPRVKPEPAKMKEHTTVGPHQSDTLNKLDPKVTSDPAKAAEEQGTHHTTRDTALAGGAAAVGVGAYEHEKHGEDEKSKSSGGFLGFGKKKDESTTHTSKEDEHHKDSKIGMLGLLHNDPARYQNDGDNEHSAREKYFGGADAAAQDPSASGVPETQPHHTERDFAAAGGAGAAGAAGAAALHEHDKDTEASGEKKQGFLSKLLHRDNPNKLHKDPPEGHPTAAAPAHETFVKPGVNHEQHIGIDGPIGRVNEVSGLGGDARYTKKADEIPSNIELKPEPVPETLHERAEHAPEGVVIEPRTGLPMNVGKYGSGVGGTDGAQQIAGYDEKVNAERMQERDAQLQQQTQSGITWDRIAGDQSGSADNTTTLATKIHEDTAPTAH